MTAPKARPPLAVVKRKTARSRTRPDPLKQLAKYIEAQGWNVAVIGPCRIEQPLGSLKYQYEFVVKFTGSKREVPRGKS